MEMFWVILLACFACLISWSWGYSRGQKEADIRYSKLISEYDFFSTAGYDYSTIDFDYTSSYIEPVVDTTMSAETGVVYDFNSYKAKRNKKKPETVDDGLMAWTLAWSEQEGKYIKIQRDPTDMEDED